MIRAEPSTVYVTEDGERHATREAAVEHEFTIALRKWADANCYTGMSREDVVQAMTEDRLRLAAIFKEYVK